MTLTTCQQIILHCLYIEPEDKTAFKRYRDAQRRLNDPEVKKKTDESSRKWREANRDKHRENVYRYRRNNPGYLAVEYARRKTLRECFDLLKMDRPCYDCGGDFAPHQMDWDHLPGSKKMFTIGSQKVSRSFDSVVDEIAKCQLVCANCHRNRTEARKKEKVT